MWTLIVEIADHTFTYKIVCIHMYKLAKYLQIAIRLRWRICPNNSKTKTGQEISNWTLIGCQQIFFLKLEMKNNSHSEQRIRHKLVFLFPWRGEIWCTQGNVWRKIHKVNMFLYTMAWLNPAFCAEMYCLRICLICLVIYYPLTPCSLFKGELLPLAYKGLTDIIKTWSCPVICGI